MRLLLISLEAGDRGVLEGGRTCLGWGGLPWWVWEYEKTMALRKFVYNKL